MSVHTKFPTLLDFITFGIFTPPIVFVALVLYIIKFIIIKFVAEPKGFIPLEGNIDPIVSLDTFPSPSKTSRVLGNVGWIWKVDGEVDIDWLRAKIYDSFIKDNDPNYARLRTQLVESWGYKFRKAVNISFSDLESYIWETNFPENGEWENIDEFIGSWFGQPYKNGQALWEIMLIRPNTSIAGAGDETNVIVYKIHHSLGDGYSAMINFLDVLTGSKTPYLVKTFKDSILEKLKLLIKAPRLYWNHMNHVGRITKNNFPLGPLTKNRPCKDGVTLKKHCTEIPAIHSTTTFNLQEFQTIRAKTGVNFMSIFLCLLAGVTRKLALERKGKIEKDKTYTYSMVSLPWPEHPRSRMVNHWTLGQFKIPLGPLSRLDSLKEVDENFQSFHNQQLHKIMKLYICSLFSLLPSKILKKLLESDAGIQIGWTALLGIKNGDYKLKDTTINSIHPILGPTFTNIGLVGFSFSHSGKVNCTLVGTVEAIGDGQAKMDRILKECFAEELKLLLDEVNTLE